MINSSSLNEQADFQRRIDEYGKLWTMTDGNWIIVHEHGSPVPTLNGNPPANN